MTRLRRFLRLPPKGTRLFAFWAVFMGLALGVPKFLLRVPRDLSLELSRSSLTHLKPETIAALGGLKTDVLITYYVSDRRRMPSAWTPVTEAT